MNTELMVAKAMLTADTWKCPGAELHRSLEQHVFVIRYTLALELVGKCTFSVLLHLVNSRHPFFLISTNPAKIEMQVKQIKL